MKPSGLRLFCMLLATVCLPLCPASARDAYRIALRYEKGIERHWVEPGETVYLYAYRWGEKQRVDSARITRNGTAVFRGRTPLPPGEYVADRHLEFFVSDPGTVRESFTLAYPRDGGSPDRLRTVPEIRHEAGSAENAEFVKMQNLVNREWKYESDNGRLLQRFRELSRQAARVAPGSLLDISLRNLLSRGDVRTLAGVFPGADERLVNTSFARKDLEAFVQAAETVPPDTLVRYADRLVDPAAPELAGRVAGLLFDAFHNSRIMGQEAVAVHVAERYFLSGVLPADSDRRFLMNSFVQLNRHSLLGMDAPELLLADTAGHAESLRALPGEYTILYFYTDDCAVCRTETPKLLDFINEYRDGVLSVYAVYTGSDRQRWKEYVRREFVLYNPFVEWKDVYDPELESGFHLLYNVISTPQMFLIDKDRKIIGRNLKTGSLQELLAAKNRERDDLYAFFGNFFHPLAEAGREEVFRGVDLFYQRSIRDTALFREIFRELYQFLRNEEDYALQEGAAYLGETYIAAMPGLWPDAGFVRQVEQAVERFNMNPPGSRAAELLLNAPDGSPVSTRDIRGKYKILFFYNFNCGICQLTADELKPLYDRYGDRVEIAAVYTGNDYNNWIKYILDSNFAWLNLWDGDSRGEIYAKYYLASVPSLYLLDPDDTVLAKDINPLTLRELLERLFPEESKTH